MADVDSLGGAREKRTHIAGLEERVIVVENVLLRAPLAVSVVCLLLGLMTPILEWKSENVYLFLTMFQSLAGPVDTAGSFTGENIVFGVGVLGTVVSLFATVLILLMASSRSVYGRWSVVGRVASALMSFGIAVVTVMVLAGEDTAAGPAILLLLVGAVTALIVMFGLRPWWDASCESWTGSIPL